jgi:hypothetical protein
MNAQDTSAEPKPDLPLEIAHLLSIDVVGYSKLLVNEQIELLQELNQIVRGTECFRAAETKGKLVRVSTGDGMALLFFRSPEDPVRSPRAPRTKVKQVRFGETPKPTRETRALPKPVSRRRRSY